MFVYDASKDRSNESTAYIMSIIKHNIYTTCKIDVNTHAFVTGFWKIIPSVTF